MHFRNIDVVVFDAMGVTFVEGDDVSNLLIPFVARECGCTNREAIRKLFLPASLGRISSQEFWARVGCAPASEREYLDTQLKLDPDFIAVAERLKKCYVLAMLSNDVSEWSTYLKGASPSTGSSRQSLSAVITASGSLTVAYIISFCGHSVLHHTGAFS